VTCEDTRPQLTAYLDGELEGDRGSAVRGHLRECEACRQVAGDEAALRDGLRSLPPVDPPATLWSGVQARLAAAEVADSKKPAWRRAVARWLMPQQLAFAGVAFAALAVLVVWKSRRDEPAAPPPPPVAVQQVLIQPSAAPAPVADSGDVTAELAAAPARETDGYADSAAALKKLAIEARSGWSDERKHGFDAHMATLETAIDHADQGRARQAAYRALIRYLQRVVVRDEVASR
jgi:hypothetical protein